MYADHHAICQPAYIKELLVADSRELTNTGKWDGYCISHKILQIAFLFVGMIYCSQLEPTGVKM